MKKRRILKIIVSILFIGIVIFAVKFTPTFIKGYDMYKDAVQQESIEKMASEIKNDPCYITIDCIPDEFLNQVIKSEDKRFYKHGGVDFISLGRAMINNVKEGKFVQGGSTITQQLAKNMYFSFEKKMERKVAEVFISHDLEKMFTKDEILELYCNIVYFGEGCYGISEAARHYYGVEPKDISKEQAGALVHTLKSPNNYNPNAI